MKNASLTVVGSGIKFISHITTETKTYIEQSNKVLYLVNDPVMKEWIKKTNVHAESLDDLYVKYPLRLHCYQAITDYILEQVRREKHVCVVLYGHPTVFAQPALEAVLQAKKEGYDAKILPGISAEDCLFSDLLIDPGSCGCQSFETTDFLVYRRKFDTSCHLLLWQVGTIGVLSHPRNHDNTKGAQFLQNYLAKYYSFDHEVIVYEAAQYPCFKPRIEKMPLAQLSTAKYSSLSTLYVPPSSKRKLDKKVLAQLSIDIANYDK
jgi:tetrapyrrole methylase family protein / MazG family protein